PIAIAATIHHMRTVLDPPGQVGCDFCHARIRERERAGVPVVMEFDRLEARPEVFPRGPNCARIAITPDEVSIASHVGPFDEHRDDDTEWVEDDVVIARIRKPGHRGGYCGAQRTGAMRDLVVAVAHVLIAEANPEKQFVADLGGPELYVRGIL